MDSFIPIVGMTVLALLMDAVWLYTNHVDHMKLFERIQKSPLTIRWIPAGLVYIIIIAAVYLYAVQDSKSLQQAALKGAGLGLAMYGVYDLTNYATLTNYTLSMTLTDMAWGATLCTAVAATGFYLKHM